MLCEGTLLRMTYGGVEDAPPLPAHSSGGSLSASVMPSSSQAALRVPPLHVKPLGCSVESHISALQSTHLQGVYECSQMSTEIQIPVHDHSDGSNTPFLVPSFCQSIYENYSDLHIGGEQVLPRTAGDATEAQAISPVIQSHDILPHMGDSLLVQTSQGASQHRHKMGSNHWWQASSRSFLLQGREGPLPNSLLNHYLEQKLLDLYQQYMMENMARGGALRVDSGNIWPPLSLDQITLQLSREGHLEAGLAKDMVMSCLLRVASDLQSGEISTPLLQISTEASEGAE